MYVLTGFADNALLGISPVVGRLTLTQEAEVRTLHPQPPLVLGNATAILSEIAW